MSGDLIIENLTLNYRYMKKIFLVFSTLLFSFNNCIAKQMEPVLIHNVSNVHNVIQAGVSITDRVPTGFFGSWKVISVRAKTNNPQMFGPYSVDIWNLSKQNDVITLSNPVSGANASISVSEVNGSTVKFEKVSYDTDEKSVETPILTLEGDNFYGIDKIVVNTYKNGKLIRSENVEYRIKAVKVSGAAIPDLFGK